MPKEIRRRFSRLAGLLEIADTEFMHIRNSLLDYEQKVPGQIAETPAEVLINKASVLSFVRSSSLVHELDSRIASITESKIVEDDVYINRLVENLKYVGLNTVAELDSLVH